MKVRSKLIFMIAIPDILITWIITRTLDYVVRRLRGRIKFKGHIHFSRHLLCSIEFWLSYFSMVYFFSDTSFLEYAIKSEPLPREMVNTVETILDLHRRSHRDRRFRTRSCLACQIITENKDLLQKLVSNPKLYPPFKFSEK